MNFRNFQNLSRKYGVNVEDVEDIYQNLWLKRLTTKTVINPAACLKQAIIFERTHIKVRQSYLEYETTDKLPYYNDSADKELETRRLKEAIEKFPVSYYHVINTGAYKSNHAKYAAKKYHRSVLRKFILSLDY